MVDLGCFVLYSDYIHKECARDSPVDHTATYPLEKVLKADRWEQISRFNPVGNDGIFLIPLWKYKIKDENYEKTNY